MGFKAVIMYGPEEFAVAFLGVAYRPRSSPVAIPMVSDMWASELQGLCSAVGTDVSADLAYWGTRVLEWVSGKNF